MKPMLGALATVAFLFSQTNSGPIHVNPSEAKWVHEARDPDGAQSVTLRDDPKTGGMELLVHYPGGHVFEPHWHDSNERIVMLAGRLSFREGNAETFLDPGGYAFLPARQLQNLACVSQSTCSFYVSWDGQVKPHPSPAPANP